MSAQWSDPQSYSDSPPAPPVRVSSSNSRDNRFDGMNPGSKPLPNTPPEEQKKSGKWMKNVFKGKNDDKGKFTWLAFHTFILVRLCAIRSFIFNL